MTNNKIDRWIGTGPTCNILTHTVDNYPELQGWCKVLTQFSALSRRMADGSILCSFLPSLRANSIYIQMRYALCNLFLLQLVINEFFTEILHRRVNFMERGEAVKRQIPDKLADSNHRKICLGFIFIGRLWSGSKYMTATREPAGPHETGSGTCDRWCEAGTDVDAVVIQLRHGCRIVRINFPRSRQIHEKKNLKSEAD